MGHIFPISGASGAGKTRLLGYLNSTNCYAIIPSMTTRAQRDRDLPNELLYLSEAEFRQREQAGEFLWVTPPIHGAIYGTLRESIDVAIQREEPSIMVITIDYVEPLFEYISTKQGVASALFILSPKESAIRERLTARGEPPTDIEERMRDSREWDERAVSLSQKYPIELIHNDRTLEEFFTSAEGRLQHLLLR